MCTRTWTPPKWGFSPSFPEWTPSSTLTHVYFSGCLASACLAYMYLFFVGFVCFEKGLQKAKLLANIPKVEKFGCKPFGEHGQLGTTWTQLTDEHFCWTHMQQRHVQSENEIGALQHTTRTQVQGVHKVAFKHMSTRFRFCFFVATPPKQLIQGHFKRGCWSEFGCSERGLA